MHLLGECFQSIAVEMYSPLVCSVLHAAVWWTRPATNISQLYLHLGKLTVFQAPLQGASSNVPIWACSAYEQHVCVFDFSPYHADLSRHHFTALSHIHEEARLRRFPVPTEMDSCCSHHYYGFSDTPNNYLCCLCCGLVWSLRWLPSMSLYSKAVGGNEALR